jgi:valyl-tRNA synthetase
MLELVDLVDDATAAFEAFDYARALERTERLFWGFCDDYLELVKTRAYGAADDPGAASARRTLRAALHVLLRLFAPFLPFVTEEAWSWWQEGSVHRAPWPTRDELRASESHATGAADAPMSVYAVAAAVLTEIRREKSNQKRSLATPVTRAVVRDTPERLAVLTAAELDVRNAGRIQELEREEASSLSVVVELAEPDAA